MSSPARDPWIEQSKDELQLELEEENKPYGKIIACQGYPRCDGLSTGVCCPWCTVIVVRADGGECAFEPGNA